MSSMENIQFDYHRGKTEKEFPDLVHEESKEEEAEEHKVPAKID